MRTGERREHQVTAVRVTLRDAQLVAVLHGFADASDVGEINLRVHALGEHVQAQGDQVHVAGALTVAEEAALDAVRAGHVAELCCRDAFATVIVRVQGQDDGVTLLQVAVHPLDGVGVDIRRDHFHRGRQVDDHRVLRSGLHDVHHCVANLSGEVQLRAGEGFRRVLPAPVGVRVVLRNVLDQLSGIGGQLLDGGAVLAEHHFTLQLRGGVVEVNDHAWCAGACLEGAADQVLACLDENLDGHILRDHVLFDDLAYKVEVRLGSGRETDLDLLVAHLHEQLEHAALALRAHRINQSLVAVTQIHRAPLRCNGDFLVRPGAVRQGDVLDLFGKGEVALERH